MPNLSQQPLPKTFDALVDLERLTHVARAAACSQRWTRLGASPEMVRRIELAQRALARMWVADAEGHAASLAPKCPGLERVPVEQRLRAASERLARELPLVEDAGGPLDSLPRVFALTFAYVEHWGQPLDARHFARFVREYQGRSRAAAAKTSRHQTAPGELALAEIDALDAALDAALLDRIARIHAADASQAASPTGMSIETACAALDMVASGGFLTAVRAEISPVDALLDAATPNPMSTATRAWLHAAIAELARHSGVPEAEVTARAVARARASSVDRRRDPAYFLAGRGRRAFEHELGYRAPHTQRLSRALADRDRATLLYLGGFAAVTLGVLAVPLVAALVRGASGAAIAALALLALLPASDLALAVMNRIIGTLVPRRHVPALELASVDARHATLVARTFVLRDLSTLEQQVMRLEAEHLGNPDPGLRFALVIDLPDATAQNAPGDAQLIDAARAAIQSLNQRHARGREPRFFLLARARVWNERNQRWICDARERGQLRELASWLREGAGFLDADAAPVGIRWVILLDDTTALPAGAARKLVGAMAHPLNRPVLDARRGHVIEGHAMMQPAITPVRPRAGHGSVFQRLFSRRRIDPYSRDVMHDLFGEASWSGRGIYDVDAVERALGGRLTEASMLAHHTVAGLLGRAALAPDVALDEVRPTHYEAHAARQHRRTRAAWQLLPWLLPVIRDVRGRRRHNPLTKRARFSLFDALRRSLVAPTALATLIFGWTLPRAQAAIVSSFVVAVVAFPGLARLVSGILRERHRVAAGTVARELVLDLEIAVWQMFLAVAMLAHQAVVSLDAVLRGISRLIRGRGLLEWNALPPPPSELEVDLGSAYERMAHAVLIAGGALVLVYLVQPACLLPALPFLAMWILSPAIARASSVPPDVRARVSQMLVARRKAQYSGIHERQAGGAEAGAESVRSGARMAAVPRSEEPVDGGGVGSGRAAGAVPLGEQRGG